MMMSEGANGCASSSALNGTDLDIEGIVKPHFIRDEDIPTLREFVNHMLKEPNLTPKNIQVFFRSLCSKYKIAPVKLGSVHYVYRTMCKQGLMEYDSKYGDLLKVNHMREQSGVMVIAVFTSPYPETMKNGHLVKQTFTCKYDCFFCPDQDGQPRSYVLEEPGVLRANNNNFHTVSQVWDRANQYFSMGMSVDKIELLVLGGTWHSYPADYREQFVRDVFYAANTYYDTTRVSNPREPLSLAEEQLINQTSMSRIVGLTIESRGDQMTPRSIKEMRRMGITRVQLGMQHTDDRVLDRVGRNCHTSVSKRALRLLKDNCFKIDAHWMPDLPQPLKEGVDWRKTEFYIEDIDTSVDMREMDKVMYSKICSDPDWQADQIKVYPCVTMPHTRILKEYRAGIYKPYGEQQDVKKTTILYEDLITLKTQLPYWIRVNRMVRDVPSKMYHVGGHKDSGAHSTIKQMMSKRKLECKSIDALEVRGKDTDPTTAQLFVDTYEASSGTEYFLSFMTPDRKTLFGFLRLRLSQNSGYEVNDKTRVRKVVFPELVDSALIRELHVYGKVVKVNDKSLGLDGKQRSQHSGFGTRLIQRAIEIAEDKKFRKISVIAGIGTIVYYRKFGFEIEDSFMTRSLKTPIFTDDEIAIKVAPFLRSNIEQRESNIDKEHIESIRQCVVSWFKLASEWRQKQQEENQSSSLSSSSSSSSSSNYLTSFIFNLMTSSSSSSSSMAPPHGIEMTAEFAREIFYSNKSHESVVVDFIERLGFIAEKRPSLLNMYNSKTSKWEDTLVMQWYIVRAPYQGRSDERAIGIGAFTDKGFFTCDPEHAVQPTQPINSIQLINPNP